jgi:hypothetical protein
MQLQVAVQIHSDDTQALLAYRHITQTAVYDR